MRFPHRPAGAGRRRSHMERRKPTYGESIASLLVMVLFIFVGFMLFKLRVELLMIALSLIHI